MIDRDRLLAAYRKVRDDLLAERVAAGHWVGELSSSALSTATAVSALALVRRHARAAACNRDRLGELARAGVAYLARSQNDDGGWGDTDKSLSNIAATMLARAALELAGAHQQHRELLDRAVAYIDGQGGIDGLRRRYGRDKTFAVPILTNCALAGLVSWREVSPLPFEMACFPQSVYRFLRMPVVSYAIPALVAIGQVRYAHRKPLNPVAWLVRRLAIRPSLKVLARMQPESGGFLEATPLTSFVVMSLAGSGRADHPVVRRGVDFLTASARDDGSWPIDTNLAAWVTTLSVNALAARAEDVGWLDCLEWLMRCQHREVHPFTGAAPGGWGWSDLSGAVPDADDTPGALLAMASLRSAAERERRGQIDRAAEVGLRWLARLQNTDGGWPTFCRGWGKLPFDRSSADLTAHALRALYRWSAMPSPQWSASPRLLKRGFRFLARQQRPDGSWVPLWFGNQHNQGEENPVYGTGRVLLAYRELCMPASEPARRGLRWLVSAQHSDGGWGSVADGNSEPQQPEVSTVEETAVAVEALLACGGDQAVRAAAERGVAWLIRAVEQNRHRQASPIGFYFAKLWYYERLYPVIFTASALGRAVRRLHPDAALAPARRDSTETAS